MTKSQHNFRDRRKREGGKAELNGVKRQQKPHEQNLLQAIVHLNHCYMTHS